MKTHLDMDDNFIYDVMTPTNNEQGANKGYVDGKVAAVENNATKVIN